jgi:hypothetical protein
VTAYTTLTTDNHPLHILLVHHFRKQAARKTDVKRFNLKKLSETDVRKQFQIKLPNRFAALENLNDSEDMNTAWENITENIKISAKKSQCLHGRA